MINKLEKIVGKDSILSNGKEKLRFDHIWKTDIPTNAFAVIFPKSTQQISEIMASFSQPKKSKSKLKKRGILNEDFI